ncbi:MAG TPA: nuclear transport factor 2 family protein [Flavobacterium sp.]|jgi:nuclear transport factor 2 (NTF2) superfamily protein
MIEKYRPLIETAYENFNKRDINGVFQTMNPDVEWPNGWESGYLLGFDEIRDYWKRQWKEINPTVIPVRYKILSNDRLEVEVQQTAKDLDGKLLYEGRVKHIYSFENGLIKCMEIENEN